MAEKPSTEVSKPAAKPAAKAPAPKAPAAPSAPKAKAAPAAPAAAKGSSALTRARTALKAALEDDPMVELNMSMLRSSMPHIPTGSIVIDYLIGGRPNQYGVAPCPGIPRGRITNLYGNAGAGKTTLALTIAATVCAAGGTVCYIDWEHEVEPRYAAALGVPVTDSSRFQLLQPNTLEDGMKIMITMASEGVDLVVVDSVGAGVPAQVYNQELDKEGDFGRMGLVAAKWSQFLPKFKSLLSKSGTALLGISQLRKTMNSGPGPDSAPQGGEAWKFYSTVRMGLRVFSKQKTNIFNALTGKTEEMVTSATVLAKLDKCKVSDSVHHEQMFFLRSGTGIDNTRSVAELAVVLKIVQKGGSWHTWENGPAGQVRANSIDAFVKAINATPGGLETLFAQVAPRLSAPAAETAALDAAAEIAEADSAAIEEMFAMIPGNAPAPAPAAEDSSDEG